MNTNEGGIFWDSYLNLSIHGSGLHPVANPPAPPNKVPGWAMCLFSEEPYWASPKFSVVNCEWNFVYDFSLSSKCFAALTQNFTHESIKLWLVNNIPITNLIISSKQCISWVSILCYDFPAKRLKSIGWPANKNRCSICHTSDKAQRELESRNIRLHYDSLLGKLNSLVNSQKLLSITST